MHALRETQPNSTFIGVGGEKMTAIGMNNVVDIDHFSVNGLVEPIKRLPSLYRDLKLLVERISQENVDVHVGVDFNVFNLMLEGRLRARGIKTVHFVSPSVWAWRRGRIKKIKRVVDHMLTLFPFEAEFYEQSGIPATFVGHPAADRTDPSTSKAALMAEGRAILNLQETDTVVALLPGSRTSELKAHGQMFAESAHLFQQANSHTKVRFVVPYVNAKTEATLKPFLSIYPDLDVMFKHNMSDAALKAANVALVKSGTATLEAMLFKTPMVVVYMIGRLTYFIVSRMLKTDYVALPNILSGEQLVPELLQDEALPPVIAVALQKEAETSEKTIARDEKFQEIHTTLRRDSGATAASAVLKVVGLQ